MSLYLYVALVLAGAYFIRGITGFGSGLIAVPLLALHLPLTFVVPLILLTDFTASLLIGGLNFSQVARDEIARLLPPSLIGVLAGAWLLVSLPEPAMLLALGTLVIVFALRDLVRRDGPLRPIAPAWAWPAALTGGTVSALFGTGGPPYVIYLSHRLFDKGRLRATLSGLFFIEGLTRILAFTLAGLLFAPNLPLAYAAALPLVLAALWMGSHVHQRLSHQAMRRLVALILLGSGGALWFKACALG